ncbi:MAG: nitrite reductase small subunit NirD [Deltaproteobacteria bacterium]|nr:nitrite reductase small subunit NirD [Deltaproteobacteria bacterium]
MNRASKVAVPTSTPQLAAEESAVDVTGKRIIVVGHGMVGHRFCEEMAAGGSRQPFRITCFGEERRTAYDRVPLSDFFAGKSAADLQLADPDWYAAQAIELCVGERVVGIDRGNRTVVTDRDRQVSYDILVLATGSAPFVPPIPGTDLPGVFVYRTIEDLEAIQAWGRRGGRAAVIGGGLLGLEAAKAALDLGLETHVIEAAPRLMPRQVDTGGGQVLRAAIERLGVRVRVGAQTEAIFGEGSVAGLRFRDGEELAVDIVIISAGIRPRDELARSAGLVIGERGGIVVDPTLATSDPHIFCIGESALVNGMIYGLVAPGYDMARALAARLRGGDSVFSGADLSAKLKLLGVEVASFGDAFADETAGSEARRVVFEDRAAGVYQKLVTSTDGRRLLGGVLVGDASAYTRLLALLRTGAELPERLHEVLFGAAAADANGSLAAFDDEAQICSCNQVSKGAICSAIRDQQLTTVGGIKACTRAGTGCGGCVPFVAKILECELAASGRQVNRNLCEHFAYTRQELFQIVKLGRIVSFDELLAGHGQGGGCEVCRPAVASILASSWNDFVLKHATIQDTNDRFLANIQRGGTYSVIPRIPGGEITPEKLMVIADVARRYDLYCKITGGQRIDLLGARVDQLPAIWEELVNAGFESGHAYGKAMRTVKSCVGSTWCRFGVQDSTALAIRIEERYRGIRAPHKLKSAVSGCIRECAEAQSKDFGVIATEKGWNLYLCGNGGSQPRHADLVASDVDEETLIRLIDRFLMYYIHTANPLERTARWLERLDGGIEYLKSVIVDDRLGICERLEYDMQLLVDAYECEWAAVVRDPQRQAAFRHFANSPEPDPQLAFVRERGQRRPEDWPQSPATTPPLVAVEGQTWVRVANAADVPRDGGVTIRCGGAQIAVYHFASRNPGVWYACQAMCPHRGDMVLGRGLLGTQGDEPKVACPMHKKTFSLLSGVGLSDPQFSVQTFPVEVRDGEVYVALPPFDQLMTANNDTCRGGLCGVEGLATEANA